MMNVNTNYTQPTCANIAAQTKSNVLKRRDAGPDKSNGLGQTVKKEAAEPARGAEPSASTDAAISEEEKNFFQQLFPAAAGEIRAYSPYLRNGQQRPPQVGTLIDVKG